MGNTYLYCRASTLMQELSPAQQEDLMRRKCEALGLENIVPLVEPLGTSGRKNDFADRSVGRWIMANARAGDVIVATKMNRLGRRMVNICEVVEQLCRRNVGVIILEYTNGEPLDLRGAASKFIVQIMMASAEFQGNLIAETTREAFAYRKSIGMKVSKGPGMGRRFIILDENGQECPGATITYQGDPGKRKTMILLDHRGKVVKGGMVRVQWDDHQLELIAELTKRSATESFARIAKDFWDRGEIDHRGKPWGQRENDSWQMKSRWTIFHKARCWFLRAGDAGDLPGSWNDVAKAMPRFDGYSPVGQPLQPGHLLYNAHQAKKANAAAELGQSDDRSGWSASDWQAWFAESGRGEFAN